jgi:uncharacterized membrane protein YphA (DoxX/SURF4 family)/intracellular sulfur oxidation DsrE/DsrF family protein
MKDIHVNKISFLVLRVMSSLIFITAGLNHLFQTDKAVNRLEVAELGHWATRMAPAETLIILSGVGLLLGGLMLLLGFKTRLAAVWLLVILIPITLTVQVASPAGSGPLFKNIALMGLLIFFIFNGAVYYGMDQLLKMRKPGNNAFIRPGKLVAIMVIGLPVLGACTTTGSAQNTSVHSTTRQKHNYAVLISQPNHVKAAAHTAETMSPESEYKRVNFVVMACAKSVEAFVKGSALEKEIQRGRAAGVQFKICGMSLKQFNIDPGTLLEGVEIIPNGLSYMFDLQQNGYRTVEL